MALTFTDSQVVSNQPALVGAIHRIFVQESEILDRLPFMPIGGNAFGYNLEESLPGVDFRGVNEGYTESTGTFNQAFERLVILGGDADVDRFLQHTMGDRINQRAEQTRLKVRAIAYRWQYAFFNGNVAVTPKGFDGIKTRTVGSQVISPSATDGQSIIAGDSTLDFLDLLDQGVNAVPGLTPETGAIYVSDEVYSRFVSALRRINYTPEFIQDDLRQKRRLSWNGVPILKAGKGMRKATVQEGGSYVVERVLQQNETFGASTDTSSIYVVNYGNSPGDQGVTGLVNNPGGGLVIVDDLGQLQEKPTLRTRVETYAGLGVFGGQAVARIRGIRAR